MTFSIAGINAEGETVIDDAECVDVSYPTFYEQLNSCMNHKKGAYNMEKKYFFFDIDGTLTDRSNHQVVPSALETLHQLEKNGHFVAIATGRAHYKAEKFTKAKDFPTWCAMEDMAW